MSWFNEICFQLLQELHHQGEGMHEQVCDRMSTADQVFKAPLNSNPYASKNGWTAKMGERNCLLRTFDERDNKCSWQLTHTRRQWNQNIISWTYGGWTSDVLWWCCFVFLYSSEFFTHTEKRLILNCCSKTCWKAFNEFYYEALWSCTQTSQAEVRTRMKQKHI